MTSYFDHAATSPARAVAIEAMAGLWSEPLNPSALHGSGRRARRHVEDARERLAAAVDAHPSEIIFTSGGTEADNLAVKGLFWGAQAQDPRRNVILASPIEHPAVLESVEWLERNQGARVEWLEVDRHGRVSLDSVRQALGRFRGAVALCAVMWANNEVGTVQPVPEIARLCRGASVPFHVDAVQAFGALPVSHREGGATTLALSAHKIGGPPGVGALVVARDAVLVPVQHGGGQERDIRSGTIPAVLLAGFAAAAEEAAAGRDETAERHRRLRERLVAGVRASIPDAQLRGHPHERLPGNAHFTFPGCEGDSLLFLLDRAGIHSSTGSACTAGVPRPSHVLLAMGVEEETARGSQRFTFGHTTTEEDVERLLAVLPGAYAQAKGAGMAAQVPSLSLHT